MAANSENSSRPSLESFRLCVQSICPKFNVSSLKESQFQALYSFICGEEVFVNLPTGSGKSLIFQLAPLVHMWMHEHILSTGDLRHQYGIFGGESQTSLFPFRSSLRDVNERRLYSQAISSAVLPLSQSLLVFYRYFAYKLFISTRAALARRI